MGTCPNCQKPLDENGICPDCGAPAEELQAAPSEEKKEGFLPKLKKLPLKWIAIGAGGAAVLAAIILLVVFLVKGNQRDHILFMKDDEIFFYDLSDDKPWQATRLLYDRTDKPTNQDIVERFAWFNSASCEVSEDGKILFFPDRLDESNVGFPLYYRHVNKPDEDPIKISSEVIAYAVNRKATLVTYEKGEDHVLYQYSLEDGTIEKIGSETTNWYVTPDGSRVCYLNAEGGLYMQYRDENKEKIDSDVTELSFVTEDAETVYYIKDNALYKKTHGAEKEKLLSEVISVLRIYESGEIYYLKAEISEQPYMDYLWDDLAEADAQLERPEEPAEPSIFDYEEQWQYELAYEQYTEAYAAYEEALAAYQLKEIRDEQRALLREEMMELEMGQLYYYDGKEARVVTDSYLETDGMIAEDTAVMVTYVFNQAAYQKVKLSEITETALKSEDFGTAFEEALHHALWTAIYAAVEPNVTVGRDMTPIELNHTILPTDPRLTRFYLNDAGTAIYYIDDMHDDGEHGELYQIRIREKAVQNPELYDSDVFVEDLYFAADDRFVYFKDVDTQNLHGDLYVNQNRIDYDVRLFSQTYVAEDDKMVYVTDWNEGKDYGTLKIYEDGKSQKISDDVFSYAISAKGDVLYLYDYSTTYYKGDLYLYRKGKNRKVDMDVVALLPVREAE